MVKRIACIGQSNALLSEGFLQKLASKAGVSLGNLGRIGASPSLLLPYYGSPDFFEGHDFCIFDTAVIDQSFMWEGAIDPFSVGEYLRYGILAARSVHCQPIILVIPHRDVLPPSVTYRAPPLQQLYWAMALRHGAIVLDMTPDFHALSIEDPEEFDKVYFDAHHITPLYSNAIAERLLEIADIRSFIEDVSSPNLACAALERISLIAAVPQREFVSHRNSVTSGEFLVIRKGERVTVNVGHVHRLHGLRINRSGCLGKLRIEGRGRTVKYLATVNERDRPYVEQIVPILLPIADHEGQITLSMADASQPATEATWQALPQDGDRCEIAELIVERPLDIAATSWSATRPKRC